MSASVPRAEWGGLHLTVGLLYSIALALPPVGRNIRQTIGFASAIDSLDLSNILVFIKKFIVLFFCVM